MSFDILNTEVNMGLSGRNSGIPIGFPRLNHHIGIRKRMYFLLGGLTGSGKTSFVDDCFVLNPYDWYISSANTTNIKLRIIYRSMERSRVYKLAKWVTRKIFIDTGVIIPISRLLSWNKDDRLSKDEHDMFLSYKDYIDNISSVVTIIDGPENPIGIANQIKEQALIYGKIEKLDQYNKIYIPDDENEIVIVVVDHIGLTKITKDLPTKKSAIDKLSDELRYARDFYGYTPVVVSQFNREISNVTRLKAGDVEPQLEDFKESGQTQDDCDVAMALFDPMRYKVEDASKYDLKRLRDDRGINYFRSLRLIKNSYGADNLRIGLGFLGELGRFKELPYQNKMTDAIYSSITDKTFFIER